MPFGHSPRNVEYIDLYELGLDFSFWGDVRAYRQLETEVLTPQLESLGMVGIEWMMGEYDSFGPLTRVVKMRDTITFETVWGIYG